MKTIKKSVLLLTLSMFIFNSCLNQDYNELLNSSFAGFDFKTTEKVNIEIATFDPANAAMQGVKIKVYTQNPLNEDGTLKSDFDKNLIYTGASNAEGKMICQINPATTIDSLYFLTQQIGFVNLQTVGVQENINLTFGGSANASNLAKSNVRSNVSAAYPTPTKVNGFYVLGTWSYLGVPSYLTTSDVVSSSLLDDINATLPETYELPKTHPEFFTNTSNGDIKIHEDAEVWVTFVHEGAGYTNTLMYYTYPTDNPPTSVSQIANKTIIFPNVSYLYSGGGLLSGNKVQLLYLDPNTNKYTNAFPAGTSVGWLLYSNGWSGSTVRTANTQSMFYSDASFNPESATTLKKHNVLLHDAERNLLLLGFEDMRRDGGSDNDFNDAVFYATSNPITAIHNEDYQQVIKKNDTDEDGVSDENDDYPNDPTKAFNNYYPAENTYSTLAFEDLWPSKGDYDFNDLVIDYNYKYVTNANNEVVTVDATLKVKAVGGSRANGFGIQFNTTPDNITNLSGQRFTGSDLSLASNGTENNQSKAVIMVFDNSLKVMKHVGTSLGVNTDPNGEYVEPAVFNIHFELKNPVSSTAFGSAPYNPFIYIDANRSKEVHLANNAPTDLVDISLLGTRDDASDIANSSYYISPKYLPWALNIPVQFDYPAEKQDITNSYLFLKDWAVSKGTIYKDWYDDKVNYRNTNTIYKKP